MSLLRRAALMAAMFSSLALAPGLAQMPERANDVMPPESSAPLAAPALTGIAHIALRVKDVAASVDFYHKLGFDHAFDLKSGDTLTESFLKINDRQFLELYPVTTADSQTGFLHLCFEAADLNALHDAYVSAGLAPTVVRTAAAGNLLFTIPGPQQTTGRENIEYTQYLPGSLHAKDTGQHLGPDRVGDQLVSVALAVEDPAAARTFYLTKLGFHISPANPSRLDLPGTSGQSVELVPGAELGTRASIVLNSPDIDKAAAQLTRQQVPFRRAESTSTDAAGRTHTLVMLSVTDPDGSILRIAQMK